MMHATCVSGVCFGRCGRVAGRIKMTEALK